MYEVRWTMVNGCDMEDLHDYEFTAWRKYHSLEEADGIESAALYYTDGDGNEKELAVWCRK